MNLNTLKNLDNTTANNVLAAAALSMAPDTGLGFDRIVATYKAEADAVIRELREKLDLGEGHLVPEQQARIDRLLGQAISATVFAERNPNDALARAGQAGRLPTGLYEVTLTPGFLPMFGRYGIKKKLIEEAIHKPDDFEHLLTEDAKEQDVISLFMKRMLPSGREPHWLLVQTHRQGIVQVAQSAWRVYPTDVDLSHAEKPLDVLKAFVETFGLGITLGNRHTKFIESEPFVGAGIHAQKLIHEIAQRNAQFPHLKFFASASHVRTVTSDKFNVGVAYCIDLTKYEATLRQRGFSV